MRFLLKGEPRAQLRRMLNSGRACLALFAAAEALVVVRLQLGARSRRFRVRDQGFDLGGWLQKLLRIRPAIGNRRLHGLLSNG